jgi:hypothetical protein
VCTDIPVVSMLLNSVVAAIFRLAQAECALGPAVGAQRHHEQHGEKQMRASLNAVIIG